MFCDNCGRNISYTDNVCPHCGNVLRDEKITKEIKNKHYNSIDNLLIREYMGVKTDIFLNKDFSFGILLSFIFMGNFYLFYRKMYFYGLIWLFASLGLSLIPGVSEYVFFFNILIAIIFSIFFKDLYLTQARDTIEKIKKSHKTATDEELKRLARVKGGVNPLFAVLTGLIYILVFIALIIIFKDFKL